MKFSDLGNITDCLGFGHLAAEFKAAKRVKKARVDSIASAMKIAETANFSELVDGYDRTFYIRKDDYGTEFETNSLVDGGEVKNEVVDMSVPRQCSYHKTDDNGKKIETIILGAPPTNPPSTPPVEERGITLRQLRAVMANIIKRCVAEKWTNYKGDLLSSENVTLYDADKYVIRPFTVKSKKSFVTCLPSTAGSQPPRFFVSHWWGEPVLDFIACIEQAVRDFTYNSRNSGDDDDRRGGGMTQDTPVWVCAYGNNQWDLADITEDPKDSGFTKAMRIAQGRTITVLDKEGVVFSRVWCIYELHLTLRDSKEGKNNEGSQEGLWTVYTAKKHTFTGTYLFCSGLINTKEERDAVGIIEGGATDFRRWGPMTTSREKFFPYELIKKIAHHPGRRCAGFQRIRSSSYFKFNYRTYR